MRTILFTLLMMGLVPYAFVKPFLGLLLWVWVSFMNPHRLTYGFSAAFPWVLIVSVITIFSLIVSRKEEHKWIPSTGFAWTLLAFFLWTVVTTIFAFNSDDAMNSLIKFSKIQVMIAVILIMARDRKRINTLVWVIALSIGFYGVKGGLFTILNGGQYQVLGPPGSFISETNEMAAALVMTIPLVRYLQLQATRRWVRLGLGWILFLCVIATFGTYSRGGLLALIAVGVMLVWKTRRRTLLLITAAIVLPLAVQFMPQTWTSRMQSIQNFQQVGSAESRIESWKTATNVALARPIVGGGFDAATDPEVFAKFASADASKPRATHSIFFQVLGDHGFVGLALFLMLIFQAWFNAMRIRRLTRKAPDNHWAYDLASMLQASIIGYLVAGATNPLSYHDMPYALMALLPCIWVVLSQRNEKSEAVAGRRPSAANSSMARPMSALQPPHAHNVSSE